jgi:hypothetical protein
VRNASSDGEPKRPCVVGGGKAEELVLLDIYIYNIYFISLN